MMELITTMLNRKPCERRRGFTLIELLVVVVIIGILAAIAVPIYLNQRVAAWNSSVESDVKNASRVVETATTENNGSIIGLPFKSETTKADGSKSTVEATLADTDTDIDLTIDHDGTATLNGEKFTVSPGNTLTLHHKGNNYAIEGTNENDGTKKYTYYSATGTLTDAAYNSEKING